MTFREMLKLYHEGALDGSEAENVKKEIEKHQAISDYLFDTSDFSEPEETELTMENQEAIDFSHTIRKTIRGAFVKAGLVVGAVTIVVVLSVIFLLPELISKFYYDPNQTVGTSEYGTDTSRMSLDLAVYTELFVPEKYRDSVNAHALGYGKYAITIPQTTSISGHFSTVGGILERNELTLYDPNLLKYPTGNAFVLPDEVDWSFRGTGAAGTATDAFQKLQDLKEDTLYTAYFSLDTLMDYESVYEMAPDAWFAVYNPQGEIMGFWANLCGHTMDWNRDKYPMLCTIDSKYDIETMEKNASDENAMKTHFISMLQYLQDHPQTMKLFKDERKQLDEVMAYVGEHGLQIYGFAVTGYKDTILELAESGNVAYVYTVPNE